MARKAKGMRTKRGNVTAKARKKHATLSGGRFPIFDAKSARSALKLRGHAGTASARKRIIAKAAKFVPAAAKRARAKDKRK